MEEAVKRIFDRILQCHNVDRFSPYERSKDNDVPYPLPQRHIELLSHSNGLCVYSGYLRLFSIGKSYCRDLLTWNELSTWKFSWSCNLNRYLCFAETGLGDQYAYDISELETTDNPPIHCLSYIDMSARPWANAFEHFVTDELLRWCTNPYDTEAAALIGRWGPLRCDEQFAYVPPVVLGGSALVDEAIKIDAVTNMIIAGDLDTEVGKADGDQLVAGVEPYIASMGRSRMRVVWAPSHTRDNS